MVLFDQCNKGDISVLLGSTDKLGVGVNIQRRAVALHHVDAPWRPDQVEQREGRVWRPKNLNPSVDLYRYVTNLCDTGEYGFDLLQIAAVAYLKNLDELHDDRGARLAADQVLAECLETRKIE